MVKISGEVVRKRERVRLPLAQALVIADQVLARLAPHERSCAVPAGALCAEAPSVRFDQLSLSADAKLSACLPAKGGVQDGKSLVSVGKES
jgi:hypothetical protein